MSRDAVRDATNMFVTQYGIKLRRKRDRHPVAIPLLVGTVLLLFAMTALWLVKR